MERAPRKWITWTNAELRAVAENYRGGSLAKAMLAEVAWREGK